MRACVLVLVTAPTSVYADGPERIEASGYAGMHYFGPDIGLGDSIAPDQRPQTSLTLGLRGTFLSRITHGRTPVSIGVEADTSFTPAFTGLRLIERRDSYFSPVLGYGVSVLARMQLGLLSPHISAGVAGSTVMTRSPFMANETDEVFVWGVGATLDRKHDGLLMRIDGRQGFTEAKDGGRTATYEVTLALGWRFGAKSMQPAVEESPAIETTTTVGTATPAVQHYEPPPPDKDSDNDGIPDKSDACPIVPEMINGVDDNDGCPESDPDGDGIVGALDKCPDQPEDKDKFQDDDGCPDDNDADGIADASDSCPNQPETKNGLADDDGCPDEVPAALASALDAAQKISFEPKRVRLSVSSKLTLDRTATALVANRKVKMKVVVIAHPEDQGEAAVELAKRRADVVRGYLIEQGALVSDVQTQLGVVGKPPISIMLAN